MSSPVSTSSPLGQPLTLRGFNEVRPRPLRGLRTSNFDEISTWGYVQGPNRLEPSSFRTSSANTVLSKARTTPRFAPIRGGGPLARVSPIERMFWSWLPILPASPVSTRRDPTTPPTAPNFGFNQHWINKYLKPQKGRPRAARESNIREKPQAPPCAMREHHLAHTYTSTER